MRQHFRPWFHVRQTPAWLDDPDQREHWLSTAGALGHYNKTGERISMLEWCLLFEDVNYRRIEWTPLADGGFVSTVWMGIDHAIWSEGPPLQFETMNFPGQDICQRYHSEDSARTGHQRIVRELLSIEGA